MLKPNLAPLLCLAILATAIRLEAQHQYVVPLPGTAERERVVHFSSGRATVEQEGKLRRISSDYYYLEKDAEYADGYMLVNRPNALLTDHLTHLEFGFGIDVHPDRDYKKCFVVLHLHTENGQSLFVPKEIGNLKGGKSKRVSGTVRLGTPVSQGRYDVYVFTEGKEIYQVPTEVPLRKKKPDPIESRSRGSLSPELAALPTNVVTLHRNGSWIEGVATIQLAVVDSGYGIAHKALGASSDLAAVAAIDLLKTARFSPGSEDGTYVQKLVTIRVKMDGKGGFTVAAEDV